MSLAHKLYRLGIAVKEDEIKKIYEVDIDAFKDSSYITLVVDFPVKEGKLTGEPRLYESSLDRLKYFFTKKLGGTSDSYYLYPNFYYQNEKELLKKFQAGRHTLRKSLLRFGKPEHHNLVKPVLEWIEGYKKDTLGFGKYKKGNYFLVLTVNGKSFVEWMPEMWSGFYEDFVSPHIEGKGRHPVPKLEEAIDAITGQKTLCGYNPDVKFFTYDNYDDILKPDIINKLPLSKESAAAIKRGWLFAVEHLRFFHMGLEYMILPSTVFDDREVLRLIVDAMVGAKSMQETASKEGYIATLLEEITEYSLRGGVMIDILFLEYNATNKSVKIFGSIEDLLPSRIARTVQVMQEQKIEDSVLKDAAKLKEGYIYLADYLMLVTQTAETFKSKKGLQNALRQERIALAKLLLGYRTLDWQALMKAFEHYRMYRYQHKEKKVTRRLVQKKEKKQNEPDRNVGVLEWLAFPEWFVPQEKRLMEFFRAIGAIKMKGGGHGAV